MRNRRGPSIITIIYLIVGVIVASDHKYLKHVDDIGAVLSLILAVLLWPLVLLDVNLHIN